MVSQKLIDELFTGGHSHSLAAFPLRVIFMNEPVECRPAKEKKFHKLDGINVFLIFPIFIQEFLFVKGDTIAVLPDRIQIQPQNMHEKVREIDDRVV